MGRILVVTAAACFCATLPVAAAETLDLHGGKTVSVSGEIGAGHTATYRLKAKRGEALSIDFVPTDGTCGFDLHAPDMAVPVFLGGTGAAAFSGTLPATGAYAVEIHGGPCSFGLTVRLGGKGASLQGLDQSFARSG